MSNTEYSEAALRETFPRICVVPAGSGASPDSLGPGGDAFFGTVPVFLVLPVVSLLATGNMGITDAGCEGNSLFVSAIGGESGAVFSRAIGTWWSPLAVGLGNVPKA